MVAIATNPATDCCGAFAIRKSRMILWWYSQVRSLNVFEQFSYAKNAISHNLTLRTWKNNVILKLCKGFKTWCAERFLRWCNLIIRKIYDEKLLRECFYCSNFILCYYYGFISLNESHDCASPALLSLNLWFGLLTFARYPLLALRGIFRHVRENENGIVECIKEKKYRIMDGTMNMACFNVAQRMCVMLVISEAW